MPHPPPPLAAEVAVIRALRAESNAGLAAHDAARVTAAFAPDIHSIGGDGDLVDGRAAVTRIYADDLSPKGSFVTGQRIPGRITVDGQGARAAEPGRWRWIQRTPAGDAAYFGDYLAGWVKLDGHWKLQSEFYVTLGCAGLGCLR